MNYHEIHDMDQEYVMQTYARFPVAIDHGQGSTLYDTEGKKYIDFASGIGVLSIGTCHHDWIAAIENQIHKLGHISNLFYTEPGTRLAQRLCEAAGMANVFFANSGAESGEGMIKLARKYSHDKYGAGRSTIITLVNSFTVAPLPRWPPPGRISSISTSSPSPKALSTFRRATSTRLKTPRTTPSAP